MNRVDQIIKENAWRQIGALCLVYGRDIPEQIVEGMGKITFARNQWYKGTIKNKREITVEKKGKRKLLAVYDIEIEKEIKLLGQTFSQKFIVWVPWKKAEEWKEY